LGEVALAVAEPVVVVFVPDAATILSEKGVAVEFEAA
jgi:hypothetical protein